MRVSRYAHSVKFLVTIRRGVSRSSVLRLWLDNHLYRSYGQAYSPEEHSDILDQLVLYRLFTGSKRLAGTCRLQCDGSEGERRRAVKRREYRDLNGNSELSSAKKKHTCTCRLLDLDLHVHVTIGTS